MSRGPPLCRSRVGVWDGAPWRIRSGGTTVLANPASSLASLSYLGRSVVLFVVPETRRGVYHLSEALEGRLSRGCRLALLSLLIARRDSMCILGRGEAWRRWRNGRSNSR